MKHIYIDFLILYLLYYETMKDFGKIKTSTFYVEVFIYDFTRLRGFEPLTHSLEGCCSILLS